MATLVEQIQSLAGIVTDAITAGSADNIPSANTEEVTIAVKTGTYREVLPIIVPSHTVILGDELRSMNAGPASEITAREDAFYSVQSLSHMSDVIQDIIVGNTVTPTSGNIEAQYQSFPFADAPQQYKLKTLVSAIQNNIDFRTGLTNVVENAQPVGYSNTYLTGYGPAVTNLQNNKEFLKEEVTAYIGRVFPNLLYSRTKCKQDVGYVVDALIYDLTYGGNHQSIIAGLAYYDGNSATLQVSESEKGPTIDAYEFLRSRVTSVINNVNLPSPEQTTVPQFTNGTSGSTASRNVATANINIIISIINGGVNSAPNITVQSITGTDTLNATGHGLEVGDSFTPRVTRNGFVKNRKYWVIEVPTANTFKVSETYGGSALTLTNGTNLNIVGDVVDYPLAQDGTSSTAALITAAETLDTAQEDIIRSVIDELNKTAYHFDFVVDDTNLTNDDFQVYVGKNNIVHTYVSGGQVTLPSGSLLNITNFVYNNVTGFATVTTASDHNLEAGDIVELREITVSCTYSSGTREFVYPSSKSTDGLTDKVLYIHNKCLRDTRLILEGVMFDFMFGSNFQTIKNGYAYLRASASEVYTLSQKDVTRSALSTAKSEAEDNVGSNAVAISRIDTLMDLLDAIIFSGSNEGTNRSSNKRNDDYAVIQIERNRDFIVSEVEAYIYETFKSNVTVIEDSSDFINVDDTSWLKRGAAVRFIGNVVGGIELDTTYFVYDVQDDGIFIAETRNASQPFNIDIGGGEVSANMQVCLHYSESACRRDLNSYIDALKYDIKYPGNYKSLMSARYYANSVIGSREEDMFYCRDATGVRNCTLDGLQGDVLPVNEFGTSRVSAGAYCSLDPGWGPDDDRAWIATRSPYIQGVTTFGFAAVGQKIDGALHNGGNDSMVSNDFTQVISDGIGAWITNNGRAELVSVFTYYARIGYLAENGGRIRGTNGNCSYGTFGAVAEGFDADETPGTATVENREGFQAVVGSVTTDGDEILRFEFDHAGNEYTEVDWIITGGGVNVDIEADEFRDGAVNEVRLLDLGDDSSGQFGGLGYLTNANTAQGGTTTTLSLAAVDQEISSAYPGMFVFLDGGKGAGQYGIINTYDAGTKEATIIRQSDGQSGWDHMVPGTAIVSPDPSTTYVVEPAVEFEAPPFTAQDGNLAGAGTTGVIYGETTSEVLDKAIDTYDGLGTGASFNVTRNGTKYIVSLEDGGTGYTRLETLTILGSNLGGDDDTNDVVITITSVNSATGEILEFDFEGKGKGGRFVQVDTGGISVSDDGLAWTAASGLTSSGTTKRVAHGLLDDGSSNRLISRFVFDVDGTQYWSEDGDTGYTTVVNEPMASGTCSAITFGNQRFVAINSDNTDVSLSFDGENWDRRGSLNSTGFIDVAYGMGKFVAIKSGETGAIEHSDNGFTWTAVDAPANATWNSIAFGNGIWVAVASDSDTAAISIDGVNWSTTTIGSHDSTTPAGHTHVAYGQGLFMVSAYQAGATGYNYVMTSENGLYWESRGVDAKPSTGYGKVAFGNPQQVGYWVVTGQDAGTQNVRIKTGAKARGRAFVAETKIFAIRLLEPGSGYETAPNITITDPNNIFEVPFQTRLGNGALATPSFISRGEEYSSANAEVDEDNSNGFADFFQSGNFVFVKRLSERPVPGSNVVFSSLPDQVFKLVNVVTFLGQNDGAYTAFLQLSPEISIAEAPPQGDDVTTRIRYSQVRLTGHDFLDIGTGNFITTNYPNTPLIDPDPAKETTDANGGRVFYTSTDQDGNFRVGALFTIEQSTGVATLNADAFNIAGLQELSLGEVTLGGGSASIDEFSTDPFFTADSDSVIPTQRAIKAYIAAQIGGGGASLNVNSVTAGSIFINTNQIRTTDQSVIQMRGKFNFEAEINGYPIAWNYFLN